MTDFVFHAKDLFNEGGNVFKRHPKDFVGPVEWPHERRFALADELAAIPSRFKLPIAIGFVDRINFDKHYNTPPESLDQTSTQHMFAFIQASMFIEQWMRANTKDEVCILIAEDNDRSRSMIRIAHNFYQDPAKVQRPQDYKDVAVSMQFPYRKIKEDPLFQPKKRSHPMVIADFAAYVMKKILMGDDRYNRFLEPMRGNLIVFDENELTNKEQKRIKRVNR